MRRIARKLMRVFIVVFFYCLSMVQPIFSNVKPLKQKIVFQQWYFNAEDNMNFATREFNHSNWPKVTIPHNFTKITKANIVWYRSLVDFSSPPESELLFVFNQVSDAAEFYFNGKKVASSGKINVNGLPQRHAYDKRITFIIPTSLVRRDNNILAIRVQKLFETESGILRSPTIGLSYRLQPLIFKDDLIKFIPIILMFLFGLFFLFLYLRLPQASENLWFSLLCVLFASYFFFRLQIKYYFFDNFFVMKRLEYLVLYWATTTSFLFTSAILALKPKQHFAKTVYYGRLFFIFLVSLATIVIISTDDIRIWNKLNRSFFYYFMILCFFSSVALVTYQSRLKHPEAKVLMLSSLLGLISMVNDIMVSTHILSWARIGHFGFVSMVFAFGAIVINRFVKLYRDVEKNNVELNTLLSSSNLVLQEAKVEKIINELLTPIDVQWAFLFEKLENKKHRLVGFSAKTEENRTLGIKQSFLSLKIDELDYDDVYPYIVIKFGQQCLEPFDLGFEKNIGRVVFVRSSQNMPALNIRQINSTLSLLGLYLNNRKMQREMLAQERLSTLGTVSATIVHDLKGPLGIIQGYASYLGEDDLDSDEKKQYVNEINNEIESMVEMTREVLDFSQGKISLEKEKKNLNNFMASFIESLRQLYTSPNLHFQLKIEEQIDAEWDFSRMRRVLFNLVKNAVEAIEMSQAFIAISIKRQKSKIRITIEDNGPGIPESIKDNLFELFISANKSSGTGLGTAIAKKVVEEHGGQIWFETEKNVGTTFTIEI